MFHVKHWDTRKGTPKGPQSLDGTPHGLGGRCRIIDTGHTGHPQRLPVVLMVRTDPVQFMDHVRQFHNLQIS